MAIGIATRVEILPEVIDISAVPTAAGLCGLVSAGCGAALRFPAERLARLTLFGNLLGAFLATIGLTITLVNEVLASRDGSGLCAVPDRLARRDHAGGS